MENAVTAVNEKTHRRIARDGVVATELPPQQGEAVLTHGAAPGADAFDGSVESGAEQRSWYPVIEGTPPARSGPDRVLGGLVALISIVVSIALAGIIVVVLIEVIGRTFFKAALVWNMDVVSLGIYIVVFLGGACAYYSDRHLRVRVLADSVEPSVRRYIYAGSEWIAVLTAVIMIVETLQPIRIGWTATMAQLQVAQSWTFMPIVVGMALIGIIAIRRLFAQSWLPVVTSGVIVAAATAALALLRPEFTNTLTPAGVVLYVAVPIGVLALLTGTPVAFAFMLLASAYFILEGDQQLSAVPLAMQNGVSNFTLVALPFFFVVAFTMVESGLGARVARVVARLLDRVRHGVLYSIIVTMFVFSGLSGSKSADIAAVGGPLMDITSEDGYARSEGAALLAASAAMGETIPPSIALLVLGSITTLSIGTLFVAGIVPAALMAVALGIAVWRLPLPARRAQRQPASPSVRRSATKGVFSIVPVVVGLIFLIGSIIAGIATPSESSAIIAAYMVVIALLFYRTLKLRGFLAAFNTAGVTSGAILTVVAAASALSNVLAISGIPPMVASGLDAVGDSGKIWFLLLTTVILIVAGSILEGLPALLIFVPLLFPVATQLGINGIQYGIVIIIAMGIGAHTPPLGVGLYTAAIVGRIPPPSLWRSVVRYLYFLYAGLIIIVLVLPITTFLPHLFGMK